MFFYTIFIIIRNIEMGCGAVCGVQAPSFNKCTQYSQAKILQLNRKIKICKPLLTQQTHRKFTEALQSKQNKYNLKIGQKISSDEEIESHILDKWRIILYGLDKEDQNYQKCLSFQVRNEKQEVTNSQNLINSSTIVQNKSYHQLKPNTQYHECFMQIEKDLNRTFQFRQQKKKTFENILKRISNYFPSMGYTQGVNFVIGYLLLIGYSQSDTFWMFIHLALNQRYLVLGLYEDGFPLAYIYTSIFKNMLRRLDVSLHDHVYKTLMLDESMWIFKWFITYYIYSFPFTTIKYIWNLVIQLGGIALVYYALSLVIHLRDYILKIQDPCDISQFFQELKDLNKFNNMVNIRSVIQKVYQLKFNRQDLSEISFQRQSFYKKYYLNYNINEDQNQQNKKLVYQWYENIIKQRNQFRQSSVQKHREVHLPQILKNQYTNLEKSINILEEKIIKNQSMKLSKVPKNNTSQYFQELLIEQPIKIQLKDQNLAEIQMDIRNKNITKMSYDLEGEINEAQNQSDSNFSQNASQIPKNNNQNSSINAHSEYFNQTLNQNQLKSDKAYALKVNTIIGQADSRKRYVKEANEKANNIKIGVNDKKSGLALAAQNILCNLSVTNSQYSSNSSKNASYRPKKHKQNHILRYNKNGKVKTEQVSQPSMDPSSSRQSSVDHHTDKDSFKGMTHRQNPKQQNILDHISNDRRSQQQFMINSQGPHKTVDLVMPKEMSSEIQIFNGDGLFKKKKRIYNRNSNIISINQNINKSSQKIEQIESFSKRTVNDRKKQFEYNQQESIDAIIYTFSTRKPSQPIQTALDTMKYEIQSVK